MIKLENVCKTYNNNGILNQGLHNVNLELNKGEIVAITGESGSGKSTLLNVITKMDTFDEGEIYFYGNETSYFSIDDMDTFRKNMVGFIFQNYNIIESYTVLKNVMLPLVLKGYKTKDAYQEAIKIIDKVGLTHRKHNRGAKLSGGEKQRCVIARALASDCEILACDEPTGNLDSKTSEEILNLIKEVAKDKLVLIVTHNYESVASFATRKILVHDGEVTEDIVLKKVEKDENKELDLDYKRQKLSTSFNISFKNLIYTPKRTFLISIIFLVIAFFTLFMYSQIYTSINNETIRNDFIYRGDNKVLVSNYGKTINMNDIKKVSDKYVVNYFMNTRSIYVEDIELSVGYEKYPTDYKLIEGHMPNNNDNECLIILPNDSIDWYKECGIYKNLLNKVFHARDPRLVRGLSVKTDNGLSRCSYTITGIAKSNCVTQPVFTGSNLMYLEFLLDNNIDYFFNLKTICYDNTISKPYLNVNVNDSDIYTDWNYYLDDYDTIKINTKYENRPSTANEFYFNDSFIKDIEENAYEVAVYGDAKKIANELSKLGYDTTICKTYDEQSPLEKVISNIISYVSIAGFSASLIIIFFMSYAILSVVYKSKAKDFNIFRTLGVAKKDMKKIVTFEVLIISGLTEIVSLGLFFALKNYLSNKKGIELLINPQIISIYIVIMLIFGYLIGRRFNRRLFKFSVNQVFKKGENKK